MAAYDLHIVRLSNMNRLRLLVLLILFTISGCSPGPDRIPLDARVSVSREFPPEAIGSIIEAIDGWRSATHGRVALSVHVGEPDASQLVVVPGVFPGTRLGLTCSRSNDTALITLDVAKVARFGWDMLPVAEHEIGHAFGLEHEDGTIMCNGCKWASGIDEVTVSRFFENYD